MGVDDGPQLTFATKADFRHWVSAHVDDQHGVWLKIAKKGSGVESVTAAEALDVALCFGWIDGLRRPYDETWFLQRYTPRRARSRWSQVNVKKVEALVESGEMTEHGLAEIERAKADGRWEAAYAPQSTAEFPPDFLAAVEANPAAKARLATITRPSRFAIIYRLHDAKRPETRARRIAKFVDQLARGDELWPDPAKGADTSPRSG